MSDLRTTLFLYITIIVAVIILGFSSQTVAISNHLGNSSGSGDGPEDGKPFNPGDFDDDQSLLPSDDEEFDWRNLLGDHWDRAMRKCFPQDDENGEAESDSARVYPYNPNEEGEYSDGTSEIDPRGNFDQPYGPPELFYFSYDPKTGSVRKLIPFENLRSIFNFASDAQGEVSQRDVAAKPGKLPEGRIKGQPDKGGAKVLNGPFGGFDPEGKVDDYFSKLGRRHLRFESFKDEGVVFIFIPDPFGSKDSYFSYAYSDALRQPGDPQPAINFQNLKINVDPQKVSFFAALMIAGKIAIDALNKTAGLATGTLLIMVNPENKEKGPLALEFEVEKSKQDACYIFNSEKDSYAVCGAEDQKTDNCSVEKLTNG